MTIKAVIFDIGGVCVASPMQGIYHYETKKGLPRNYINVAIVNQGEQGAFQKFERGEIKLLEFYDAFGKELSDPIHKEHYSNYLKHAGQSVPLQIPDVIVDGRELFHTMMAETTKVDPHIFQAITSLKESGRFKIAALTNNFEMPDDPVEMEALGGPAPAQLRILFDYFIESRLVGLRKPDPAFFRYACEIIGVQPHEAVFLDDIGINLSAARKLGMTTIKVQIGRSAEAVRQLEDVVRVALSHGSNL